MKEPLQELFEDALKSLETDGVIPAGGVSRLRFEQPRQKSHGDLATNVALILAKGAARIPRELAQAIVDRIPDNPMIERMEIAGPGFINVHLSRDSQFQVVRDVLRQGADFGRSDIGAGRRVLIEFVSANPTGPLHVGHGRGAAFGDTLGKVLEVAGYAVDREYYVNDAGRQMRILALSVWLRYLQLYDPGLRFPAKAYQGGYLIPIAEELRHRYQESLRVALDDETQGLLDLEDEAALDRLIGFMQRNLDDASYQLVFQAGLQHILKDIKEDLASFGVEYDRWYSENSLHQSGALGEYIDRLKHSGHAYESQGALWFRSTDFGDEKDRVVVRENGVPTYFAPDIAYHAEKLDRGYDMAIDVLGADHHGYFPRVKAAVEACGYDGDRLRVEYVQFAALYRGGQKVAMSTRGGEFVTLRELREEVGVDAARFFYAQRKPEQHMDFDLDLAKSESNDNPVYYVQYAHARICNVFRQAAERGIELPAELVECDLSPLGEPHEVQLSALLSRFPTVIETAARNFEPHQLVYYLRELANGLHTYYNACRFLDAPSDIRNARLALISATRQVLAGGLSLVGVSAPESM